MNVKLESELAEYVKKKVASGRFSDESEVVAEAIRGMIADDADEWTPEYRAYLRREIELGYEDLREGRVGPFDLKQMMADQRRKLQGG